MTPQHAAALEYASRGWHVFPLAPNSKIPLISKKQGGEAHLDATTDAVQINEWWLRCPNANIGVSLKPSGLYVLDVDTSIKKDGTRKKGRESLAKIDGLLTDTLTALTPRGGLHAIYQCPPDLEPRRYIDFDDGLDLLGEGYIVLAPSVFVDPKTGERGEYRWNRFAPIAPLPQYLHDFAKNPPQKVQLSEAAVGAPLGEGGRNAAMFRLGCALRSQGLGQDALAAALWKENQARCKPPLDDAELGTILDHVMQQVTPHRDAAAGALVEQELREMFTPEVRARWVDQVAQKPVPPTRFYKTGFDQFDTLTGGGLPTRRVCGVLGPPSTGKSAFVDSIAAVLEKQVPVLLVSTELEEEELFIRQAAKRMQFPWRDGVKGLISREEMQKSVQGLRIKLIGCDMLDRRDPLGHVWLEADKLKQEFGVAPVIVIDYVQLLARGAGENMKTRVGELTMQIRIMAQTLDCAIIAVFSTNRNYYGGKALENLRKTNDPTAYLAAAKESGDIEYDCAIILYLDVDKNHEGQPKPARVAVARCRMGDVGFVGARARLDLGVWYGDPSAVAEMTHEERTARATDQRLDSDCERLLMMIKKLEGRSWREIKMASGLGFSAADSARARLLETGRIRMERVETFDSMARAVKKDIIKVNNEAAPER